VSLEKREELVLLALIVILDTRELIEQLNRSAEELLRSSILGDSSEVQLLASISSIAVC